MPFISFSCLTALSRTSNIVLERQEEGRHPCLITYLCGQAFYLSLLNDISYVVLTGALYQTFPSIPFFSGFFFLNERVLDFVKWLLR